VQRKAYVSGVAALLAVLLVGCTGGSSDDSSTDNSNPGDAGTASAAAQPGKYRTLPEPCSAVSQGTLDSLLPGIKQITDEEQRDKAYEGEATQTFDTDRKVGCRWKADSTDATDRLYVDFERVVSYRNAVSDDSEAEKVFATQEAAADLPEPATSSTDSGSSSASGDVGESSASASESASDSASPSATPSSLLPRTLSDLGDEAFLDDALSGSGSTAQQRTVTVAFRTSNVIVTIEYEEQPTPVGTVPDSKEMQDRAASLADTLAG
jgi:hypothetical protein